MARIVSPVNGAVLTTVAPFRSFSANRKKTVDEFTASGMLVDAVYNLPKETVYAMYSDGSLVKAWTGTNPATIENVWKFVDGMLYEKDNFDNLVFTCKQIY